MRKKRFNALLSLIMVFSLVIGQPSMVWAQEIADVTINENNDAEITDTQDEEESSAPKESNGVEAPVGDNDSNTEGNEADENSGNIDNGDTSQPAEGNDGEEQGAENNDNDDQGVTDEQPSDTEDNGNDEADPEENVDNENGAEKADEDDKVDDAQNSAFSVEKKKAIEELGFSTMNLNSEMLQEKSLLSKVVSTMSSMEAGKDYVDGEIIYIADSEKEAKEIAECYGGTIVEWDYNYDIAVASIEQNVYDAIKVASDMEISIPAVYPNVIYRINDEWDASSVDTSEVTVEDDDSEESDYIDFSDEDAKALTQSEEGLLLPCVGEEEIYAVNPTDPGYNQQWHHTALNTVEAWDATKGSGVEVAVLDSGVDFTHPDLPANMGYVQTVGYGEGKDDNGHGTHCAGIIAALQNGIGGVGIAPEASIYSVKILNAAGSGSTVTAIKGMRSAVSRNVDVISMSFGSFCYDALFQKEIDAAVNKGIVLVAAAGNDYTSQKSYPAAYNNVIAVASVDAPTTSNGIKYYTLSDYSNYGTWVDIAAPGRSIYSTLPTYVNSDPDAVDGTDFGPASGTSMACPVVAATVALMLANNSTLKNTNTKAGVSKITKILLDSADQTDTNRRGGARSIYDARYYPLVDVEAATYAVDDQVPQMPTVKFSSGEPTAKNVVLAGENEQLTFSTTTKHAKIYYTVNGKKPTPTTGRRYYEGHPIILNTSGKVKIQAITVMGNKKSKVFSKTYNFDVKATALTSAYDAYKDDITVAIGKSIQLNVNVLPDITSKKKLEWSSDDATGMIKVNKSSGKVTCNKNATAGLTAVITAKTTDGSDIKYTFTVKATSEKVEYLQLNETSVKMSYWTNYMKNAGREMKDTDQTPYVNIFQLIPSNTGVETKQYLYKSSNKKVAWVTEDGWVIALGKGKAKITVTANDGSGMKAVCNVTVVTPVYDIFAYSNTGYSGNATIPIGTGCTISMKTIINDNSRDLTDIPNNKALEWSSKNPGAISVKNGKVKCSKTATVGDLIEVTVSAKDGWGTSQTIRFRVVDKIEKISIVGSDGKEYPSAVFTGPVGSGIVDPLTGGDIRVKTMNGTGLLHEYFLVNISNRDVVFRYTNLKNGQVEILATKPGTSKITYTARDGSNKKITLTFKVSARQLEGL